MMRGHIRNWEAIGAADNPEAFGLTEADLKHRTPKEILGADLLKELRSAGYDVVQRVSQGDAPFVRP